MFTNEDVEVDVYFNDSPIANVTVQVMTIDYTNLLTSKSRGGH